MTTTAVPVTGFNVPAMPAPIQPAPQLRAPEPAIAQVRSPTGEAWQLPGQVPGAVQQQQVQQPAQQQPASALPDVSSLVSMLQAALATQSGTPQQATKQVQPAENTQEVRPNWMAKSANEFDPSAIHDPIIRSMATVMQAVGKDLDLDRVLGRALTYGDPALIDMAYLRESGGQNAQQLSEIAKGIVQSVVAKSTAITNEIYTSVGGEANWSASVAAFNKTAPPELRVTVSQMLDSTNEQFIRAGAKLVAQFGAQSGQMPQLGAGLLNTASAAQGGQGISKVQFTEGLRKLSQNSPGYTEAREALFSQRAQGKRVGI